jgi:transcription-repair coupling factor (superfamily II helicase)
VTAPGTTPDPPDGLRALLIRTEAYRALAPAAEPGAATRAAGGVSPCGAALLASCLLGEGRRSRALLVAASQEEAEDIFAACRTFAPRGVGVAFFPSSERRGTEEADPATASARLNVCRLLAERAEPVLAVAPVQAVVEEVPAPETLRGAARRLHRGQRLDPEELLGALGSFGFKRLVQVERPGDCARRGGIVDVFPFGRPRPLRLEFDGDELASLREFDPATQRSAEEIEAVTVAFTAVATGRVLPEPDRSLFAYVGDDCLVGFLEEPELREKAAQIGLHAGLSRGTAERRTEALFRLNRLKLARLPAPGACAVFPFTRRPPLGDSLEATCALLRGHLTLGGEYFLFGPSEGDRDRVVAILRDKEVAGTGRLHVGSGDVREGFMVSDRAAVISTREILGRTQVRRSGPLKGFSRPGRGFFSIQPGDLVVHVSHGIGRFLETRWIEQNGLRREFLVLEYRDGVKLFVPVAKADLVARYVGSGEAEPRLDKLTGTSWLKRCKAVERAVHDMASELIEIQAQRRERPGFAFPEDDEWQRQLEASFPFEETPDQAEALRALKADMTGDRCMDRLLCGDVGYGKTEIAIRAAFKAVCAGKQVAVLVPTTVLAEQHYETFGDRLSAYPVTIEVLSRFRTRQEQKEVVRRLGEKAVDIVIGTHRLLSKDIEFHDLGLVIIDEEQRFGVAHKERFKRLRATVDVLTMTATPIPRTLHMALLGLRDISNLTTPPEGRAPVRTEVCRFSPQAVRESILRELDRDGQVYFVHNRVRSLRRVKDRLEGIVPEARVAMAHGQMPERELSRTMQRFLRREIDVLVTTTIIESGLDIPNVNTIFVTDADRYGLADLHQLRGRVGRYRHQAYAFFVLPEGRPVGRDGEKRLRSIETYSDLGAGFQLALKDLELRGAGNILGAEQSGHIAQVGYDMYCRLLSRTVAALRKEARPRARADVELNLRLAAHLPEDYVPAGLDRLELYRRIGSTPSEEALDETEAELRDRFGPLPEPARTVLDVQRLRLRLGILGVRSVGREGGRPAVAFRAAAASELVDMSPVPMRPVDGTLYVVERRAAGDREALEILLAWSEGLLGRVERKERLVGAS